MIFSWRKNRRRQELREQPVPLEWQQILERNVRVFARLRSLEQAKLLQDMQVFVSEKNWEGCDGLEVTDEMKVTVAAQACLLVLAFEDHYYELVQSILLYPNDYFRQGHTVLGGGLVLEGESHREGEAWYRGPVILSWPDVLEGSRYDRDGRNLVFHEFAHQLDMENGRAADGTPPLATESESARWSEVVTAEFQRLERECRMERPTLLDCYGTTNLAEFFAVATECFFERPRAMIAQHPELYEILRNYYRQDPVSRF